RDHYIRLDSNDYSVHPAAIGRLVEVRADLQTVTVTLAGTAVAEHARCWARHQSLTDPAHHQAAAAMRATQHHAPPRGDEVERRSLTDYDAAFGLTDEQVA
ncbi:MAG: Integrase catalytic region, partial [Nocardioides sp.]|nr:Integrase catalytic region [Nocardioides sp.]